MTDLESLTLLYHGYMDVESHRSLPSYFIILLSQNNYRYRIFNGWTLFFIWTCLWYWEYYIF